MAAFTHEQVNDYNEQHWSDPPTLEWRRGAFDMRRWLLAQIQDRITGIDSGGDVELERLLEELLEKKGISE